MSSPYKSQKSPRWYTEMPDPMVLIFIILLFTYALSFFVQAGAFERIEVNGQTTVVAESFAFLQNQPSINFFRVLVAIPKGLIAASEYLFIVFIAGGLFHIVQRTGALENCIATIAHKSGADTNQSSRNWIITGAIFVYGFFGAAVGFENNIALVPIAILVAAAIGSTRLVGVAIAVGGIGIGFALSPINPYTIGVAQSLGELPLFSGWQLRTVLLLSCLLLLSFYTCKYVTRMQDNSGEAISTDKALAQYQISKRDIRNVILFFGGLLIMLYGVFAHGWYISEIAATFLIMAIVIGAANGLTPNGIVTQMIEGASTVTGGALVVGMAASIQVLLAETEIIDTIIYYLSALIGGVPIALAAVISSVVQGIINFFIPGGSGQALATMPILIPMADIMGMSRQLMITSFQIGDGVTNLIVPTSGGTLAMLALARVSYAQWLKMIIPFTALVYVLCWIALVVGYYMHY